MRLKVQLWMWALVGSKKAPARLPLRHRMSSLQRLKPESLRMNKIADLPIPWTYLVSEESGGMTTVKG
jgi:hypothetical protein